MKLSPTASTFVLWTILASSLFAAPGVAPTEALPPDEQRKQFHLPPGFEIQLVVSDPDIGQPMNLNFDAFGRLWITHSIEYPYPAKGDVEPRTRFPGQGDHEPRDRLTVVDGIGEDGRPEKITHFAGGLNIPIGNAPLDDGRSALVYSIPNIYRVTDTNRDGVADKREVVYGRFGNIDTHGMANSFRPWIDGWIYGCHGFANTSEVKDASGHVTTMTSGNTYRFRADGSRFEQWTWGQVNPFGMTFDPWGNLFDSDCHSMPIYMLLRGGYYPSFGKPHDGLGFAPTMIDHGHGSTGICGPAYYGADQFPDGFRGSVFICNPVNCVVHHDRLKQIGSTFLADTQPDFITCDDGWFRPVDLTVGPDGALYVADFYNCIIGHYEVTLDHPRRDRTHGRVWRVIYKGTDDKPAPPPVVPNLVMQGLPGLALKLGDSNLVRRTLATNWLVYAVNAQTPDKKDTALQVVTSAVREAMAGDSNAELRAHGLWVLERVGDLNPEDVTRLAADSSPLVRTHLMRALAERDKWTDSEFTLVRSRLKDENAMVQRVAADALGRHPHVANVTALFQLQSATPTGDTHLIHVTRMSIRDQLRDEAVLTALSQASLDEAPLRTLAELAVSVKTPAAADLVVEYLDRFGRNDPKADEYVAFAGQYLNEGRVEQLARLIQTRFADNPQYQFQQLRAIHTGLQRRGVKESQPILAWARKLTERLLSTPANDALTWTSIPAANAAVQGDPWERQQRASADGNADSTFWCSLPRGERLMGTLRSGSFEIPAKLGFFTAGHNGPAGQRPETPKNFIRLRDAASGELLVEAKPPRNDTAQRIEWDLSKFAGRRGVIELVDGFDATGYAWLAVGRFSLPALNEDQFNPHSAAMQLIAQLRLTEFRPKLETLVRATDTLLSTRRQAAEALQSFAPDARIAALLTSVGDANGSAANERILTASLSRDAKVIAESLADTMLRAPRETQRSLAELLASDHAGGEALLVLAATGKASPRLLLDPVIRNRLNALKLEKLDERIASLTAKLPSENEQLLKLIDERRNQFSAATASAEKGLPLFEKNCAICHQVEGKGQKIGPQLDGIGARGLARLVEDVLDPNRNVDPAFRAVTLQMTDGRVLVGLIRRTEGETIVLADNKGKEFTVAKSDIEEQQPSTLSLMPANVGETLSSEDFQHLLAFLLSQQMKPHE